MQKILLSIIIFLFSFSTHAQNKSKNQRNELGWVTFRLDHISDAEFSFKPLIGMYYSHQLKNGGFWISRIDYFNKNWVQSMMGNRSILTEAAEDRELLMTTGLRHQFFAAQPGWIKPFIEMNLMYSYSSIRKRADLVRPAPGPTNATIQSDHLGHRMGIEGRFGIQITACHNFNISLSASERLGFGLINSPGEQVVLTPLELRTGWSF